MKSLLLIVCLILGDICLLSYGEGCVGNHDSSCTIYVDYAEGDENADGNCSSSAWKYSPGDVRKEYHVGLGAGDTVCFKGGVRYHGEIVVGDDEDGTLENPIVFKTAEGWGTGKAIFDGAEKIQGTWQPCESQDDCLGNVNWMNIFSSTNENNLSMSVFRPLFEQDDFLWFSQDPPAADPFFYDRNDHFIEVPTMGTSNDTFITPWSITDPNYFTNPDPEYYAGTFVAVFRIPNVVSVVPILAYNPANHTIFGDWCDGLWERLYSDRSNSYSIIGHQNHISFPGQATYHSPSQRIFVWPRSEANLNSLFLGAYEKGFYILGDSVQIQNLIFVHYWADLEWWSSGNAIRADRVSHLKITDNDISFLRNMAGQAALQIVNCDSATIERNTIHDIQKGMAILATGTDFFISDNTITKATRLGIWGFPLNDSIVDHNTLSQIRGTHSNAMSFYGGCNNVLISNNVCFDNNNPFTMERSDRLTLFQNIFFNNTDGLFAWGGMSNVSLVGNDFLDPAAAPSANRAFAVNNIINGGGVACVNECNLQHLHNIYLSLQWNQRSRYDWYPGPGEDLGSDNQTTSCLSSAVANAYRIRIFLLSTAVVNSSTIAIPRMHHLCVNVSDIVVFDGEYSPDSHTVTGSWPDYWRGNSATLFTFDPPRSFEDHPFLVEVWPAETSNFELSLTPIPNGIAHNLGMDPKPYLPEAVFNFFQNHHGFDFFLDQAGNRRPQNNWDIGAIEYTTPSTNGEWSEISGRSALDISSGFILCALLLVWT